MKEIMKYKRIPQWFINTWAIGTLIFVLVFGALPLIIEVINK